jgi:hypothetical protein
MFVIFLLPQPFTRSLFEFVSGLLLETLHERKEVAGLCRSTRQEMKVVGHDAIGMDREGVRGRQFPQSFNQPLRLQVIAENTLPFLATSGNEETFFSSVVGTLQAYVVAFKLHRPPPTRL